MDVLEREVEQQEAALTPDAFRRLLQWLDDGVQSHGERYLEMRRRLVAYFDRRNRPDADDLADETLNRIARTLESGGVIAVTPPARYCYVVARFVLLEDLRRGRRHGPIDETRGAARLEHRGPTEGDAGAAEREQHLDCLDRCLAGLKPRDRALVVEYYRDARRQRIERRRALAARLGISMNALAIRASRIRATLEACMGGCRDPR